MGVAHSEYCYDACPVEGIYVFPELFHHRWVDIVEGPEYHLRCLSGIAGRTVDTAGSQQPAEGIMSLFWGDGPNSYPSCSRRHAHLIANRVVS
jgi:hypothetical protein